MKIVASSILLILMSFSLVFSQNQITTERYAIITVKETNTKYQLGITVGSKEEEKVKSVVDMSEVVAEMEKLNSIGYKLLNASSSTTSRSTDAGLGASGGGYFSYMFVFVKVE